MSARATVHAGPNGGVEFRLWSGPATFRIVGKFKAWPYLADWQREQADAMARERQASKASAASSAQSWREIMRGV